MPLVFLSASLPLLGSLLWATVIATTDHPWPGAAAVLLSADLVLMSTIALVGIVLGRSRWARRLGVAVSVAGLVLGVFLEVGVLWALAVAASAAAVGAMTGPWLKGWVRERPAALGPPSVAVILELLLLAVPGVVGVAGVDGVRVVTVAVSISALGAALWYGRTAPGAVAAVRVGFPAVAIVAGLVDRSPSGLVLAALGLMVAILAWTPGAHLAARPLTRRAHPVPIPPELTPPEVLEAAGLDEHGRRRPR